ncbi:hypothetical protein BJ170DRAFT_262913 [Xylariales sp. AK1849]|nr:hypothetical protein BJ170DRAFT_262913 [Xylariales sp. AK1849]
MRKILNMSSSTVPRTAQVIPGASVSIVLKADQRTGRQVQGVVRDILTRGDHHRGIKVRLADGRIGRVQRMETGSSNGPQAPSEGLAVSGTASSSGDGQALLVVGDAPPPRASGWRQRYRDIRSDEPLEAPQEQIDLAAYIVAPKHKGKSRSRAKSRQADDSVARDDQTASRESPNDVSSAMVTCPVCGGFEGDEAAVAHHVAEHFE